MVRSLLTLATTIALAAHALLGCCAHHHHSADGEGVFHVHAGGKPLAAGQHCAGHHADGGHDEHDAGEHGDDEHGDHEPCDELDCQFVSTPRGDEITLVAASFFDGALLSQSIGEIGQPGLSFPLWGTNHPPDRHGSSQSLRAQTQVWLI